jgi:hypothetical protein
MLIFELFQPQTEGMGFLGEKDVEEAANAAQQAAIAIAMKKAHKKPKSESLDDPAEKKNGRNMPTHVSSK